MNFVPCDPAELDDVLCHALPLKAPFLYRGPGAYMWPETPGLAPFKDARLQLAQMDRGLCHAVSVGVRSYKLADTGQLRAITIRHACKAIHTAPH